MYKLLLSILLLGSISSNLLCHSAFDAGAQYYKEGCSYGSIDNHLAAITCFNKAIALCPNQSTAWEARAMEYVALDNYAQALVDYNQAIKLNPLFKRAYVGRAICYFKLGNIYAMHSDIVFAAKLGCPDAQSIAFAWGWAW